MHLVANGKAVPLTGRRGLKPRLTSQTAFIMRFSAILFLGISLHVTAVAHSQNVTVSAKNVSLENVFRQIRNQTGYTFVYRQEWMEQTNKVNLDLANAPLKAVLDSCFKNQPFSYSIVRKTIVLREREAFALLPERELIDLSVQDIIVRGRVVDDNGEAVSGASVVLKGTKVGTSTDKNGEFSISVPEAGGTLVVSFVGFVAQEVKLTPGRTSVSVKLVRAEAKMDDVVVTGIVNRKKESFTGASVSFKGDELKMIGNQNIIQSLKTLDPSFILTENNLAGSNPNTLPDIEIRGKSSITTETLRDEFSADPNQPLFILDGFETSLRMIVDLDMNRVESITLLKDAASTAIYGARAANGVVVIETKKPKPGAMQLYYTGDFRVEMPDLRDYNMMNAEEKLEFERLAGRYTIYSSTLHEQQLQLDALYNSRLKRVREGVNTYWLSEPVQTGFTNGHSLRADGGDANTRYGLGVQYRKVTGAMKGSGRDTWGANFDIIYRKGKFNVSNKLFANGYTANESPYGSFSAFANANPYFAKRNEDGEVTRYLEISTGRVLNRDTIGNPLYDALLNNFNTTKNFSLQNNLQVTYNLNNDIQIQGSAQVKKDNGDQVIFYAPEHSMFLGKSAFERGRHTNKRISSFGYQANVMVSYGRLFGGIHQVNANLRAEVQENRNEAYSAVSIGFPSGTNGNPAFAFGYDVNGKPSTAYSLYRRNNVLLSGSYTFNRQLVADFSYRLDGSTSFGSNKKYSPFWSTGIAWNLHNTNVIADQNWINVLRLKANIGLTGNQNFGGFTSISVYTFEDLVNNFGQGVTLSTLGNPNMEWQNTLQTNIGADFTLFGNKVSGFVNAYRKYTDPLVVALDLPSSTGLYKYPKNVGHLTNNGIEANLKYSPIYRPAERVVLTFGYTGIFQKAVFGGLNNELESLNKVQQENKTLLRYRDGYSPEDIWAVYSYGIDPATGRELFRRKSDGLATFEYSSDDIVRVGNSRPLTEGVFSTNFSFKGLNLGVFLRYRFGGDVFNTALFNKVENITDANIGNNQDKRALYDRWKNPGDISRFKGISITEATQMSSRFVQEENTITGESINLGYDFQNKKFLKRIGMKTLRLNAYMNDIFRISSIQRERGIDYPFARSVSFSINASF